MDLGRVFDHHDALLIRDEVTENVRQGGFTRAGSTADEDVLALTDLLFEQAGQLSVDGAELNQILHAEMLGGEFPDSEGDASLTARWDDSRYTAAIRKSSIENGLGLGDFISQEPGDVLKCDLE